MVDMMSIHSVWTRAKALVRVHVDQPLIAMLASEVARPLSYFGLPAEGEDLQTWRPYINLAYAVDRNAGKLRQLVYNMQMHCPSITVYTRLGEIENLILDGDIDLDGQKLRNQWDEEARSWRWAYDLINLDAFGIFLSGRTQIAGGRAVYYKRTEAIKRLFALQKGHSFVLLITVPREAFNPQTVQILRADLQQYLNEKRIPVGYSLRSAVSLMRSEPVGGRLTPYLLTAAPLLLAEYSAIESFNMTQCLVLTYSGNNNAPMLHIASRFDDAGSALPTSPDWEIALKAPYLEIRNEGGAPMLRLSEHQSPLSNAHETRETLSNMGIILDD